jgi:hypothetical protein
VCTLVPQLCLSGSGTGNLSVATYARISTASQVPWMWSPCLCRAPETKDGYPQYNLQKCSCSDPKVSPFPLITVAWGASCLVLIVAGDKLFCLGFRVIFISPSTKTYKGHGFETSNFDGGEWSASRSDWFVPTIRSPGGSEEKHICSQYANETQTVASNPARRHATCQSFRGFPHLQVSTGMTNYFRGAQSLW